MVIYSFGFSLISLGSSEIGGYSRPSLKFRISSSSSNQHITQRNICSFGLPDHGGSTVVSLFALHYFQTVTLLIMSIHSAVASAVILPESDPPPSPSTNRKRRQSSFSDDRSKRPRLGRGDTDGDKSDTVTPLESATKDNQQLDRRRSGQMEERKRGQRLFGALLGTLSQSSSSTAQKRRTDIEKKQQAKLKLQAEEQDEMKKQKLEALLVVRRREQRKFDKQSVRSKYRTGRLTSHRMLTGR